MLHLRSKTSGTPHLSMVVSEAWASPVFRHPEVSLRILNHNGNTGEAQGAAANMVHNNVN